MGLTVQPVSSRRDLGAFVAFPWKVYSGDPHWVPPLKSDVVKLLDPKKHPFHEHAEVQPFLARRDGKPVGRIVAHVNRAHNEFHEDNVGFFGMYECLDDPEASEALFRSAFDWLAERGRDAARGPMDLSTNEVCGLLIEGQGSPTVMMPYNPPRYLGEYEAAGLVKAKDLVSFLLEHKHIPDRLKRMSDKVLKRYGCRIEQVNMKNFDREVDRVLALYNRCWEKNWGFVPMTENEVRHMASELRMAVDPVLVLFLVKEDTGEDLGFIMGLPDLNQALKHANGKLFPFGLLKILWHRRKIRLARVLTLGVVPEQRGKGFDAALIAQVVHHGAVYGYDSAECGWVLEDNAAMASPLQNMTGAPPYRRYRVYERAL